MILNLFSIFDPSTYIFSLNWFSTFIGLLILPQIYWLFYCRFTYLLNNLINLLWNEFKLILNFKFNLNNLIYILVFFIFFVFNNFIGLFPYIFTRSRHLVFSLWISLRIWLRYIIFGWLKNSLHIFIHLVPLGTPFILIFFIVLIELLRNIIRPITLSIRLVANIVAGHLLLTLLANFISKFLIIYIFIFIVQFILLFLEIVVSLIQSYVFIILLILYIKETN